MASQEKTESKLEQPGTPTRAASDIELVEDGEAINEKRLLRKLDLRLLPAVSILYLLSFLDRSNGVFLFNASSYTVSDAPDIVANARLEGLADDLGMTGNQYLTGLTLYFIGYVIFEVGLPAQTILIY
jgi:hypothetical protein